MVAHKRLELFPHPWRGCDLPIILMGLKWGFQRQSKPQLGVTNPVFCRLNYRTSGGERSESNRRPSECKSDALPTWATPPKWWKLRELNPNLFVFSEACRPATLSFQWHRKKGLNLHKEFWRLSCYHYTIAIYKTKKNKKPQAFDLGLNMIKTKK